MNVQRSVTVVREKISIPTYSPFPPDRNPMFLERRVYQGSSGRVYPLPYYDRIEESPAPKQWDSVRIENEFIEVVILPEIGGRIHSGRDKTNGYEFFYNQSVIKPALVGLAGPWISGGVEFNWPQHHRPGTYMPVDVSVEEGDDGSITAWLSDHDPMTRMKGMHGVCIHPGKSYIEVKVRLYNRTELTQTFLWWANLGVRVHDDYQSFFPPDVHYVADHAKRAISEFPLCRTRYYGVDYSPGTRLDWFKNIPVPTSYMAIGSQHDFVGGYDHRSHAGLVHVANHHISPGKKQWTWGNSEFGNRWYSHLTDNDGPYIELMAGVYTDNQPDFSFLTPGETKTFSQFWYPIQSIGPLISATIDGAMSIFNEESSVRVGVVTTAVQADAVTRITYDGKELLENTSRISPSEPLLLTVDSSGELNPNLLSVQVRAADGRLLAERKQAAPSGESSPPRVATEPNLPGDVTSNEELFLIGQHLDQYRHATRDPEEYWNEAIRRDPGDFRCNNAMGTRLLKRGEFRKAIGFFQQAIERLTVLNPNPSDGEPYYNLGLAQRFVCNDVAAYSAFYKATWNSAWCGPAFHALAEIDARQGEWEAALDHIDRSLGANAANNRALNLRAIILKWLGRQSESTSLIASLLAADPLDVWALYQSSGSIGRCAQKKLDIAIDCLRCGQMDDAIIILMAALDDKDPGSNPIVNYFLAYVYDQIGDKALSNVFLKQAQESPIDYCFPSRLEEMVVLVWAAEQDVGDGRARYYLGNLLYDKRRQPEAVELWSQSVKLDPQNSVAWRNLGIGLFNVRGDAQGAKSAYDEAFAAAPNDARVFFERDQLWKRTGVSPAARLEEMINQSHLVSQRDDLSIEFSTLLNQNDRPAQALDVLASRVFQPWEGGEGMVLAQYVRAYIKLGKEALEAGHYEDAVRLFQSSLEYPQNLGEAPHPLANRCDIYYWLGEAYRSLGDTKEAERCWTSAVSFEGDFQDMSVLAYSELTYFQALAFEQLGESVRAHSLLNGLLTFADELAKERPRIDYFATSLPTMLLFNDDLGLRQQTRAKLLEGLAMLGLGQTGRAQTLFDEVLLLDPNNAVASDFFNDVVSVQDLTLA